MSTVPRDELGGGLGTQGAPYAGPYEGSRESSHDKAEHASIGELVGDISQGLSTLMRQEVELAKAEVRDSAKRAGKAAGQFGAAALAGWMTLLFLSIAVWEFLASALESRGWAAVIVMAAWGIAAAVLAAAGRKNSKQIQGLPRTTETAKRVPDALKGNEETS
ncbi:phage holin family protein [Terrabacter sp. 2RAF25]|uniref:phage holin family protein n=1 Tax=Terrabacter sp. 2RAF25 TaxID=3232998 RepID=UPI003F9EA515